ncbi:hypothetical protein EI427_07225 [Flammeovirga pectinis]|uniref:Uncharacterized protein n=1 Tax=Flammeovirga pectinis TaxID=2494373 RepID=A0A3Q9FK86_9BACT|nr:hypothetical protein [Flammeovirga pectinis]AZQ62037.1 hypothetical protein EI427_07225 [Flammeovirga pectinis]
MLRRFIGLGALFGIGLGDLIYKYALDIHRSELNHKTTVFITCVICIFIFTQLYQFSKDKSDKWLQSSMILLYMMGGFIIILSFVLTSFLK